MYTKRNSSVELFRILCVLGILLMHGTGEIINNLSGNDMTVIIFVTSICNISSSCLMILSGYYGMVFSSQKLISLYGISLFWSIFSLITKNFLGTLGGESRQELLAFFFPVLSSRNWFVTGYIYILILSNYINLIFERMDKKQFSRLLMILLTIFSILPTFFFFDPTNTGGKGIIHLFIMYLIGAYIYRYVDMEKYHKGSLFLLGCFLFFLTGILNIVAEKNGVRFCFLRDCSIFTIAESIIFCTFFLKFKFYNNFINMVSKNIISVILGENVILMLLKLVSGNYFDMDLYSADFSYFWKVLIIRSFIIVLIAIVIEKLRSFIFIKPETFIAKKLKIFIKETSSK